LKKRSKKLLPGASHAQLQAPQSDQGWDACGAARYPKQASRSAGKRFLLLFFKKEVLP
jgi:hypothetical protein